MSNPTITYAFRDAIVGLMHEAGLSTAAAIDLNQATSYSVPGRSAVIDGLPWTVLCRREVKYDFATALRDVASLASQNR